MTTGWLLLLLLMVSTQRVYSQSTTDDETCSSGGGKQQSEIELLAALQQLFQQHQTIINRLDDIENSLKSLPRLRDCSEIYNFGARSDGVYTVYVDKAQRPLQVYCDMTTRGGGWTVFQRRQDGSVDFYRDWMDYQAGFGNLPGEFWFGNDNLHLMTSDKRQRLRVDLADWEGNTRYAEYDNFTVDSASEKYRLVSLGTYTGNAGDSLTPHVGQKFSTRDQDNDMGLSRSCAVTFKGAWWYANCHSSNLNGRYLRGNHTSHSMGVNWYYWRGNYYSLRFTEMKFRPLNFPDCRRYEI